MVEAVADSLQRHLDDIDSIRRDLEQVKRDYVQPPIVGYLLSTINFPAQIKSRIKRASRSYSTLRPQHAATQRTLASSRSNFGLKYRTQQQPPDGAVNFREILGSQEYRTTSSAVAAAYNRRLPRSGVR